MRTRVFVSLVSAALSLPVFAQKHDPACQKKLDYLEKESGINQKALIQAFKNVKSSGLSRDYVMLAKLGSGESKHDGMLQILDLKTGGVTQYPITHGVPENSKDSGDENLPKGKLTYFGGMQITPRESDKKRWRLSTEAVSPSLVSKLQIKKTPENEDGGQLGQQLLHCSDKFKRNEITDNDLCLKPGPFAEVRKIAEGEAKSVALFLYPAKDADVYFKNVKLDNDAPPTCEYLSRMPEIGQPFDAKPSAPMAVPYAPPGSSKPAGKAR